MADSVENLGLVGVLPSPSWPSPRVIDTSICQLMDSKVLFVPPEIKIKIKTLYGHMNFSQFDTVLQFNERGLTLHKAPISSYASFWEAMNMTNGDLQDQFDKLKIDNRSGLSQVLDLFNLMQSSIRTPLGEYVWYT